MDSKERLDLYKERYYFELSRKDQLKNGVAIPLGLVTLLLGSLEYLIVNSDKINQPIIKFFAGITIIITVCFIVRSGYLIWKSYYKYSYLYMPNCQELDNYWSNINGYCQQYPDFGKGTNIYETYLLEEYKKNADINITLNNTRTDLLFRATTSILIALIFVFISLGFINYQRVISWSKSTFSPIVNRKEVKGMAEKPKPNPQPPPPKPPTSVFITDGAKKPTPK